MKYSSPFSERSESFDNFRWEQCNSIHHDLVNAEKNFKSAISSLDVWLLVECEHTIRKAGSRLETAKKKLDRIQYMATPDTKPSLEDYLHLKDWLEKTTKYQISLKEWAAEALKDWNSQ